MPADNTIFFGQGGQLRSGFGKQILGKAPTTPAYGFGSSTRDAGLKLYASAEHDKAKVKSSGGNQSQGAIYKVPVRCSMMKVPIHTVWGMTCTCICPPGHDSRDACYFLRYQHHCTIATFVCPCYREPMFAHMRLHVDVCTQRSECNQDQHNE